MRVMTLGLISKLSYEQLKSYGPKDSFNIDNLFSDQFNNQQMNESNLNIQVYHRSDTQTTSEAAKKFLKLGHQFKITNKKGLLPPVKAAILSEIVREHAVSINVLEGNRNIVQKHNVDYGQFIKKQKSVISDKDSLIDNQSMGYISNHDRILSRQPTLKENSSSFIEKQDELRKLDLNKIDLTVDSNENAVILNLAIKEVNEQSEQDNTPFQKGFTVIEKRKKFD